VTGAKTRGEINLARPSQPRGSRWAFIGSLLGAASAAALAAGAAKAETTAAPAQPAADSPQVELAPVIVTARRVKEDLQKVPVSVTAISGKQLEQQSIVTPSDLQFAVPSLTVNGVFGHLTGSYAIRGLSTGVVTYFSEAPGGPTQVGMPFFDLSSTQVLNGPQGTLFGRAGAAGAVLITPEHPDLSKFGGSVDLNVGDYGREQLTAVVNLPIITDELALRLAYHKEHIDGYTSLSGNSVTGTPGSSQKLDESNSDSFRAALEWKHGAFDNYAVYSLIDVDQTPGGQVLSGANPSVALLNLPTAYGPAVFGGICATAVADGLSSNVNACISQRLNLLSEAKATLVGEAARLAAGGDSAVRSTIASADLPAFEKLRHQDLVDVAQYDFGNLGFTTLSVKNIFSYQTDTSVTSWTVDGVGGLLEEAVAASTGIQQYSLSAQQNGNLGTGGEGPPVQTFTDEVQLHGDAFDRLISWTAGGFYQGVEYPTNLAGVPNIFKVYAGTLTPNLGYSAAFGFQDGGHSTEEAGYGQATIDLSRVGVHGLSITGGIRDTWDNTNQPSLTPVIDYVTGALSPGALIPATAKSSGVNYTVAVNEQVTKNVLLYVTSRQGYVPGGVNEVIGATSGNLPNFTPVYQPETVQDVELGVKADFTLGDMRGRLDADLYRDNFTNIQEQFTASIGAQSAIYEENVAAARMQGAELHLDLLPAKDWEFSLNYSYTDAQYTKWIGEDPFNVAAPGEAVCIPTSPAGYCFLDLHKNPFPYAPANQASLTVRYHLPVDPAHGGVTASMTGYYQSREYLINGAQRVLQLLPNFLNAISQPQFATLNARLEWDNIEGSRWKAAIFVNNLTNTTYALAGTPQIFSFGVATKLYAPPRMVGVNLSYAFGG
jgi:iron complex outermembrane receptor protein